MPSSILANFCGQHDALPGTEPGSALLADRYMQLFYAIFFCLEDIRTTRMRTLLLSTLNISSESHLGQGIVVSVQLPDLMMCLPQMGQKIRFSTFMFLFLL